MTDDLASFFAKKKSKAAKNKAAIRLEDVAQHLETNLKLQNENEDSLSQKSERDQEPIVDEDPEFYSFDTKPTIPTVAVGVGVFSYTDEAIQNEAEEKREERTTERAKTWAKPEAVDSNEDVVAAPIVATPTAPPPPTVSKSAAYRPPGARSGVETMGAVRRGMVNKVDIKSEEMFPSIGDADKMVKQEKVRVDVQRRQQAAVAPTPSETSSESTIESTAPPRAPEPPQSQDARAGREIVEQTPPPTSPQRPAVYQPPRQSAARGPSAYQPPEPQRQQQTPSAARPEPNKDVYLPAFLRGEDVDRTALRQRLADQPGSVTGVRNARGEEIRYNAPAAPPPTAEAARPKPELSWRRRDP